MPVGHFGLARVLSLLSTALWTVGDSAAAILTGEQAAEIAEGLDDAGLKVVANFCRGGALRAVGEYRRAADYLCRNLPLLTGDLAYKSFGLAGLASVLTLGHLAWSLAELGEFVEARRHAEEALNLAHAAEHPYSLAHAHLAMGGTLVRQGSFGEAMGMLERGLELCRTVPFLHPAMPLVLRQAGALPAARRVKGQFRGIDLLPTLLELLGQPVPKPVTPPEAPPAQKRAASGETDWRSLSPEERKKRMESLTPEQRAAMMEEFRKRRESSGGSR